VSQIFAVGPYLVTIFPIQQYRIGEIVTGYGVVESLGCRFTCNLLDGTATHWADRRKELHMVPKRFSFLLCAAAALFATAAILQAQDFQRSYSVAAGGHIVVSNVSGDVKVLGYGGDNIAVMGFKEGPDKNMLQIEDSSGPDRLEVKVRYPDVRNCNASVRFEVRVPKSVDFNFDRISSVSGDVELSEITGRINAESVSGDVAVTDVTGVVNANSVSGDVKVDILRLQGTGNLKFSSISGDVNVKAPADLNAEVEMSTLSGSLKTDFPITIQERRYGPGRSARGKLGAGLYRLRLTSISGGVDLIHR
jgi:hypothetical protein